MSKRPAKTEDTESRAAALMGWAMMCETVNRLIRDGAVTHQQFRAALGECEAQFRAHYATDAEGKRVLRAALDICEKVLPARRHTRYSRRNRFPPTCVPLMFATSLMNGWASYFRVPS